MKLNDFEKNRPLRDVCTFGIGGPAQYFAVIETIEEMQQAILSCNNENIPFIVLGRGSNCLFDDRGYAGAVLLNKIGFFESPSSGVFHVGAGYNFSLLGTQTARQGYGGLEFASGIPGTVGGAIFMNAGANGHEVCEVTTSVDFVDAEGVLSTLKKGELQFAYRTSSFHHTPGAIVGATFTLTSNSEARQKQIDIITYRKRTQPYSDKSAGCIFRNPPNDHAGALIQKSGLKGLTMGGAQVSDIHANFIINHHNASSADVMALIKLVKEQVKEKYGVELESEVRYIPYEEAHATVSS